MGRKKQQPEPLRVLGLMFNDIWEADAWKPEEPWDVAEWVTITVGDSTGGSNFQVHVCTPMALKYQDDKRNVFIIEEYVGIDKLVEALNDFIAKVEEETTGNLYHELATHWRWEYGGMR